MKSNHYEISFDYLTLPIFKTTYEFQTVSYGFLHAAVDLDCRFAGFAGFNDRLPLLPGKGFLLVDFASDLRDESSQGRHFSVLKSLVFSLKVIF